MWNEKCASAFADAPAFSGALEPVEEGDQRRDDDELQHDPRPRRCEGARPERREAEGRDVQTGAGEAHRAPDKAAGEHGDDQRDVVPADLFRQRAVQQPRNRAVGGQLKGHRDGHREEGRHSERQRAQQRREEADAKPPLPAADEAAEQGGQMHRQKHFADGRDLPGQEGQHVGKREKDGGIDQILQGFGLFCGHKKLLSGRKKDAAFPTGKRTPSGRLIKNSGLPFIKELLFRRCSSEQRQYFTIK